jgi:hypothetical protein
MTLSISEHDTTAVYVDHVKPLPLPKGRRPKHPRGTSGAFGKCKAR